MSWETSPLTRPLSVSLSAQGIDTKAQIHANLDSAALTEHAVANGEGKLAKHGPLVVETGKHTGRSAKDKFIVKDGETADTVWWGKTNVAMTPEHFAALKADFFKAVGEKQTVYVADLFGGSQPEHRVNVRVKKTDIDKRLIDLVFAEQARPAARKEFKKDEDYDDLNFD